MADSDPARPPLDCSVLVEIVTDYLEGRLPPDEHARFEGHIEGCKNCRNYLDQMRKTLAMAGRLTEESLPGPLRDRLLVAFQDWKSGR
ncbi:MAG: anti-sigma factor family protein [Dehalococcoidia bacterium]